MSTRMRLVLHYAFCANVIEQQTDQKSRMASRDILQYAVIRFYTKTAWIKLYATHVDYLMDGSCSPT